jgi:hypothetical protein
MAKTKVIRRRVVEDAGVQRPGWEQVGRYMYCFGQLEQALGDLLHRSLGLSKRAARLLLPRVMYAAKLDLIETIIPMLKQPESWKSRAKLIVLPTCWWRLDDDFQCYWNKQWIDKPAEPRLKGTQFGLDLLFP